MATRKNAPLWLLLSGAALATVACSAPPPAVQGGDPAEMPTATDGVGAISLALTLGGDFHVDTVHYDISGNGFHRAADVSVAGSTRFAAVIGDIPIGTGYLITLTIADTDHRLLPCSGSAPFDVIGGVVAPVAVHLACKEAPPAAAAVPIPRAAVLSIGVLLLALGWRRARALAALVIASLSVAATGCAGGKLDAAGTETAGMALQVVGGANLDSVDYRIDGPGSFVTTGTIDVSNSASIAADIAPIPPGMGFQITLAATSREGNLRCTGSQAFDVAARQTTQVLVHLLCQQMPHNGSVSINGAVNACPLIDGINANPAEALVGGAITLAAAAHDADHMPAPLTYQWSASGGMLSDAGVANPRLTCTTSGTVTITLVVSDGDPSPGCADSQTLTVVCTPR